MDVISYSEAALANGRIEKINANPDSTSGIVTQPSVIASGETVTIPAGRTAILANTQVDGVLNIDGEVFVPSGATVGYLEEQIASKVGLTGDQTKDGVLTLTSSPIVPTPTVDMQVSTKKYVDDGLAKKQATLTSGTDIKTINGNSLLGSGDIAITETAWGANDNRAKTALNASGTAPIYACRAWVNFRGTETVAIRASGNVSSITDNGVGAYTVNFTTAMTDDNYSVASSCLSYSGKKPFISTMSSDATNTQTASITSQRISCAYIQDLSGGSAVIDVAEIHISIFR